MSSRDLYRLAAILRDPVQREAAINVITGLAGLKASSADIGEPRRTSAAKERDIRKEFTLASPDREERDATKGMFFALLSDKDVFPTSEGVVTALNQSFGFRWKYSDMKRESRNKILARAWERLETLPHKERSDKLRTFCDRHRRFEDVDAYKELFKILSRSE